MTLRVFLQQLHRAAAVIGADTEVRFQGLGRHMFVDAVKRGRAGPKTIAVVQLRKDKPVTRNYQKERYHRLKREGKCVRCLDPNDNGKAECDTCLAISREKERGRRVSSQPSCHAP